MTIRDAAILVIATSSVLAGAAVASDQVDLDDASYSLGYKLGDRVRKEVTDISVEQFLRGFEHGYTGSTRSRLTEEEMIEAISEYQKHRVSRMRERRDAELQDNADQSISFQAKNAKRPGVVTTASGLQYEVMVNKVGPRPKATDIVVARYHGTLPDGTVFDSTRERGDTPAEFPLDKVIPGWTEGLQLMAKGAKYKFYVPPELAYGKRGAGSVIGPNQLLIFEVELIDFRPN